MRISTRLPAHLAAVLALGILVAACGASPSTPAPTPAVTPAVTPVPVPTPTPATGTPAPGTEAFVAALATWQARGIDSYTWQVSFGCECLLNGPVTVTVEAGTVATVSNGGNPVDASSVTGFPLTVEALLARAIESIEGGGTAVTTWREDGLPASVLLDPVKDAVDDELTVTILAFEPAA